MTFLFLFSEQKVIFSSLRIWHITTHTHCAKIGCLAREARESWGWADEKGRNIVPWVVDGISKPSSEQQWDEKGTKP